MSAAEIIDAIGRDKAVILSRELGGKFVYVPEAPSPDNPIAEAVGLEVLEQLTRAIGSGALYIPVGIYKSQRDQRLNRLIAKGVTAKRLARALRLSERTVRHLSRFDRIDLQKQRQSDERTGATTHG